MDVHDTGNGNVSAQLFDEELTMEQLQRRLDRQEATIRAYDKIIREQNAVIRKLRGEVPDAV